MDSAGEVFEEEIGLFLPLPLPAQDGEDVLHFDIPADAEKARKIPPTSNEAKHRYRSLETSQTQAPPITTSYSVDVLV